MFLIQNPSCVLQNLWYNCDFSPEFSGLELSLFSAQLRKQFLKRKFPPIFCQHRD